MRTVEGREFTGVVDSRTDSDQLWLRREADGMAFAAPVRWSRIDSAAVDGERVNPAQVVATLTPLATQGPRGITSLAAAPPPRGHSVETLDGGARARPTARPRVMSLAIDASLANLDRDAAPDGIDVAVAAIDEQGHPVPVRGNLMVRLWGEHDQHGANPPPSRFIELQRWNQVVALGDFVDGAAVYRLRFRTVQPEQDLALWPDGLVSARLGAHGQGVYQASQPIMLRKFNPYRDRLQLFTGSRFVRGELAEPPPNGRSLPPRGGPRVWTHDWRSPH